MVPTSSDNRGWTVLSIDHDCLRTWDVGWQWKPLVQVRLRIALGIIHFFFKYSRVRLRVLASSYESTHEFVCEYSRVRLRVLACPFATTREFVWDYSRAHERGSHPAHSWVSTRVWAVHHSRILAHARKWYSRVMLRVTRVARTRMSSCVWAALYLLKMIFFWNLFTLVYSVVAFPSTCVSHEYLRCLKYCFPTIHVISPFSLSFSLFFMLESVSFLKLTVYMNEIHYFVTDDMTVFLFSEPFSGNRKFPLYNMVAHLI